jgi:hypothetical protein
MRRRAKQGNRIDENPVDFLDEDEQDEITRKLAEDASVQLKEMNDVFGIICIIASIGSLAISLLVANRILGKAHAALAAAFHYVVGRISARDTNSHLIDAVIAGVSLVPIVLLSGFETGDSDIHWSLSLGNVLTTVGAIFLRREKQATANSIKDLHDSKYRYKSI